MPSMPPIAIFLQKIVNFRIVFHINNGSSKTSPESIIFYLIQQSLCFLAGEYVHSKVVPIVDIRTLNLWILIPSQCTLLKCLCIYFFPFFEIKFINHRIHPFKVYNPGVFTFKVLPPSLLWNSRTCHHPPHSFLSGSLRLLSTP